MMRQSLSYCIVIAGLLACSSGCGLLSIPYLKSYPGPHMRKVVVHDEQTGDRILNADITCTVIPWEGSIEPPLPCRADDSCRCRRCCSEHVDSWKARYVEDGRYELSPRTRVSKATIWLPLPPVPGAATYDSYASQISVAAPGYDTLIVPGEVTRGELEERQIEKTYRPFSFADDLLHIYLRRSHSQMVRRYDPWHMFAPTPEGVRYETTVQE